MKKGKKREDLRSFYEKALIEDDPNYLGKLAFNLVTPSNHSLSSSQNISTHLGFFWPIKESYMDHMIETPREHTYVVGFKSGIGGKERVVLSKIFHIF